jgi:hypothetical protein
MRRVIVTAVFVLSLAVGSILIAGGPWTPAEAGHGGGEILRELDRSTQGHGGGEIL